MLWMLFTLPVIAVGLILFAIMFGVQAKEEHKKLATTFGLVMVAVALVVSMGQALYGTISGSAPDDKSLSDVVLVETPDIYFIIPDRMPSHDALLESGYDNSAFIAELESRGYYVNPSAHSVDTIKPTDGAVDTSRTPRFVASVLNLGLEIETATPYNVVSRAIKYHEVGKILKANGYEYHHVGTWWAETEVNEMANVNYVMEGQSFMPTDELSIAVMDRSIFRYLTTYPIPFFRAWDTVDDMRRAQHDYQLETVKTIAQSSAQKFVFVHLILPHPPYVWTADGNPQLDMSLTQQQAYIEQVKYAENYILEMIDSIPDGIVLVQADEGMAYLDEEINKGLSDTQWNGVLSAWKIPGNEDDLSAVKPNEILKYVIEGLK
jgi:hypothetical protein